MSIDDMKIRSKVGDSVADLLKKFGCLEGMSQSNQISLFGQDEFIQIERDKTIKLVYIDRVYKTNLYIKYKLIL